MAAVLDVGGAGIAAVEDMAAVLPSGVAVVLAAAGLPDAAWPAVAAVGFDAAVAAAWCGPETPKAKAVAAATPTRPTEPTTAPLPDETDFIRPRPVVVLRIPVLARA